MQNDPNIIDLKWHDFIAFARADHPRLDIYTQEIGFVARRARDNFQRIGWMILAPSFVGGFAFLMARSAALAEIDVNGELSQYDSKAAIKNQDQIATKAEEIFRKIIDGRQKLFGTPQFDAIIHHMIDQGTEPVRHMASTGAQEGLSAILSSSVIASWTMFETAASDLWEAALNAHPKGLSEFRGNKSRYAQGRKDREKEEKYNESEIDVRDKSVPLSQLHKHDFDLRNKMGSALRTRFRFDSLGGIREAYALAFSKNYDAIDVALGDKAIDALAAVRNVLVHRSGLADDTYVRQCEFLPIPRTSLGDQVKLDGTIVANLLMASFRKQLDLTSAVDNWVRSN